jgi:hypothetical protein
MSPSASLQALPTELIEHIIIYSAYTTTSNDNQNSDGNLLKTIANLSRTCRRLHSIIYHKDDLSPSSNSSSSSGGSGGNLWKELFLAVWDDPRVGRDVLARRWADSEEDGGSGKGRDEMKWREECIRRMEAKRVLRGGVVRPFGFVLSFLCSQH